MRSVGPSKIGSGTTLPTTYRHTVTSGNARQKIPFVTADRIPNPPSPYALTLAMKSGAAISVDVSGNVAVTAPNTALTTQVLVSGSMIVTGIVTVGDGASGTFTSAEGLTITVQDGIVTNIF